MQETLRNAVAVAVVVLGGLAFFAFPFRPSLPWIALAGIPALLLARVLAGWSVEALRLRRSPLYGEPDRRFLRLLHGTVMFAGAYLFCCLFAGAALTLAFGEHHLRPGVIRTWHPQSNHPRRGHGCTRVSAVIETPRRRIPVDMCVSNRPGTRLWPGARLLSTTGLGHHRIAGDATVIDAALRFLRGEAVGERVVSSPNLTFGFE